MNRVTIVIWLADLRATAGLRRELHQLWLVVLVASVQWHAMS